MRISDWSSDVCSSDLAAVVAVPVVAILAAIAIPAYNDYTIRAEATAGLVGAASAMQRAVDEFEGAHDRCPGNDDFAPLLKQFAAVEKATTVQFGALANGNCAFECTLHGKPSIDGRAWLLDGLRAGGQAGWGRRGRS